MAAGNVVGGAGSRAEKPAGERFPKIKKLKAKVKKPFRKIWYTFSGDTRGGDLSLTFFTYVMILLVVGLVMMSSASYAWAYSEFGDGLHYAVSQGRNAIIGFVGMLFMMKFDYHNFKKLRVPFLKRLNIPGVLFFGVAVLLVLVLAFGNDEGGSMGARRWLTVFGIDFQPSEVAKFSLIIYFAYLMERDGRFMKRFGVGIVKYVFLLAIYVGLIAAEKHISGIMLISAIAIVMILCGGADLKQFIVLGVISIISAITYILVQYNIDGSYVQVRIKSWRDPFADVLNDTWQTANSLIAIGSGGLFGLGLGNSRQKYLYLPETKNDFVFPIVCEELGFVGALAIIIVFLLLVIEGYSIAARSRDRFGMLIAVGITTQIGIQTVLNLAVVSNLIPNTGISLPFFSYGGTALVMQLLEMGIMLNISQQRYVPPRRDEDNPPPPSPRRREQDRKKKKKSGNAPDPRWYEGLGRQKQQ